jgi:hypothetical protein
MISKSYKLPTQDIQDDFKFFLDTENNKRIFFSGKFGIGKTDFLKTFFENNIDSYEVFHLYPVNYQINTNEDIVEFLRYDILITLLNKNPEIIENNDFESILNFSQLLYLFGKENLSDVIKTGLAFVPKLGKPLKETVGLFEKFQEFKKNLNLNEKTLVENYIQKIKSKNIKETDELSNLIKEKIKIIKKEKNSILILDDLDRIDPEHIFRILNIFSAHFDDDNNKFGFDSIILVGDIHNIKSIFHHKYGEKTDFSGYFDKFFSIKPYYLDNMKIISENVKNLVKLIKNNEPRLDDAINESGYIKLFLSDILSRASILENQNKLSLRQLYRPLQYDFSELKKGSFSRDSYHDNFRKFLDISTALLVSIFGNIPENFVIVLGDIKNNITINDTGHAPYKPYALAMLKQLTKVPAGGNIHWNDYNILIIKDENNKLSFDIQGSPEILTKLFYDLLIDYVKKQKYKNINEWEYEV